MISQGCYPKDLGSLGDQKKRPAYLTVKMLELFSSRCEFCNFFKVQQYKIGKYPTSLSCTCTTSKNLEENKLRSAGKKHSSSRNNLLMAEFKCTLCWAKQTPSSALHTYKELPGMSTGSLELFLSLPRTSCCCQHSKLKTQNMNLHHPSTHILFLHHSNILPWTISTLLQ